MADYIDKSLGGRETILVRGRFPTFHWVGAWATLILLGPLLIGVILFIGMAVHMTATKFAVTTERVVLKRGLFRRTTEELAVETIEGVAFEQSVLGRLFGYGRLIVRGAGQAQVVFPNMAHPIAFRRAIEAGRENARAVHFDARGAMQMERMTRLETARDAAE